MGRKANSPKKPNPKKPSAPESRATASPLQVFAEGSLKPHPTENEPIEDLAVFSSVHRQQLPVAIQAESVLVGNALASVQADQFDDAISTLKEIGRASVFSDWRLFIRGLICFYQKDFENAKNNWSRMDPIRRPARIAAALYGAATDATLVEKLDYDSQQLEVSRTLLRRKQLIDEAKKIALMKHRNPKTVFSVSQVAQLKNFRDNFQRWDKLFVSRFTQACVQSCMRQPDKEVFMLVTKAVNGPNFDPNWNLFGYCYTSMFQGAIEKKEEYAKAYITESSKLTHPIVAVRNALTSCLRVGVVKERLKNPGFESFFSVSARRPAVNMPELCKELDKAIAEYPKNHQAHEMRIDLIEMELENEDLSRKDELRLTEELMRAKWEFIRVFPNEVDVLTELVEDCFELDELDRLKELVPVIADQRIDDPMMKALEWRLKICGAFVLCKKKTGLAAASKALDEAEVLWPKWHSKDWLPFLRSAIAMRDGNRQKFDELNLSAREACNASKLLGDVMTFAALQSMHLPSASLKPFRAMVVLSELELKSISVADLCEVGKFYWDLVRTKTTYPGYEIQSKPLGKMTCDRLSQLPQNSHSQYYAEACCWIASHGMWLAKSRRNLPAWIMASAKNDPKILLAVARWILSDDGMGEDQLWDLEQHIVSLKSIADTESDSYYRYSFVEIASDFEGIIAEAERMEKLSGPADQDDDDDDDDEYEDNDCECESCRARRARRSSRRKNKSEDFLEDEFGDESDDEDEDDDYDDYDDDDDDELDGAWDSGDVLNDAAVEQPKIPLSAAELKEMRKKRQRQLDAKTKKR